MCGRRPFDTSAMPPPAERGHWGSRLGFILAAAGSAVGLGNIWGFPTQVGRGGGAIFVLLYLACVFLICFPIVIAELALGRRAQKDPVSAYEVVRPGSLWYLVGALGVLTGVGILSFYSVIAGWTLAYVWFTGSGALSGSPQAIGEFFGDFVANAPLNLALTFCVLSLTAAVILGGVRAGIERTTKVMMPALLLLLAALAIRGLFLPGAPEGLAYYLQPDISRLFDMRVINAALGQAFFSLSLGMGAMITYGSYLPRTAGIPQSAMWVAILDTCVALLAGFVIFPAGFSIAGFDPGTSGPGLIFQVLPRLFETMPGGHLFGALFFVLLALAALTSTISLLEVPVAHLIDARGWRRRPAVLAVTAVTFLLAVPSALSNGAVPLLSSLPGLEMDFLSLMATVWNNYSLPIGGLLTSIFVGHVWRVDRALEELLAEHAWFPGAALWGFLVRWISPVAIFGIIVATVLGF
jgi:NSS family neurotransmitter:Na+ symporter